MLQTGRRFALFAVLLLASGRVLRQVSARSGGAPVAACGDLTQQHFSPPTKCGSDCPFSVSLVAIDGMPVPPGAAQTYKCGSEHTLRVATSDSAQTFRGFAIQARESTETFSSEASFLGEFVNAPASGDWRIWSCDADSATHTNPSDKTSVNVTWQAPANFGPNVTMWFSITRMFTNFHAQIRGLQLSPSAECPPSGNLSFSCRFQVEGNHIVASSCQSEGFIPASFECQIDDQPKYTCTSPFLFPLDSITGVGEHTVRVIANTFFPDSVNPLTASSKFTINPRLDCTASQSDSMFNVKCTPNDQPDSVSCTINGASHTPCELDNIQIDARDFEAGSSNVLVVSFTVNGMTAQRSITFTGLGRDDPFEVSCSRQVSSDQMTIIFNCVGNRAIVSQVCTLNEMEIPDCKLPLSIAVSNLSTGVNTLEINLSDAAGETVTYATNITIAAGLSLSCGTSSRGGSLDVFCEAEGGEVTNVTCNYDNGAIIEPCNLAMSIDLARFEPGDHILLLTVEIEDGRIAQANIPFRVAAVPFQANCVSKISEDNTAVTVECTANRDIASQICTLNGVDIDNCTLPLEIAVSDLITGNNSIQIVLVDEQGDSATFSTDFAVDRPTELSLQCKTSTNDGKIQVSCVAEGGVVSNVTCVYDDGAITESCALDTSIDVNRFEAGSHMLVIIARTADGLMGQAIIRFSISVEPLKLFCNVYGLPGRVDISCEASRKLAGLANCSLDIPGFPSAPCNIEMFSVTAENLTPGEYVLIIDATDVLGQSASLDVSFTLTAGVEPGFRILIGSVLLGQRPELLDFAARSGSTVSVMAADTPRTVVVQRNVAVTINCSNWFNDNPGNSTYISRTQLDELGNELSESVRLLPEDSGRIMVNDKSVTITRTLLVQGAEDPDFSLFMCVSCMTTKDGLLENCASASVTVYPIGSAPKIDAAADGEPPTVGEAVTTTKVGADFCLNFPTRPSTLQIICNDVNEMGVVPVPSRSWYKDGILAITQLDFGQVSFNEDFLNQGRNGLLRFGTLEPSALIAIPGASPSGYGELFLNFMNLNITGPGLLPSGVNASNLDNEVFSVLLGRWECRVDNTFGEDSAVTELSDCAIVMFVLDCTTTLAGLSGPLRVNCFGSRDIESVECSYDNGTMVEACNFPVTVDFNRFDPGSHTLLVNVMSTGGEIATHEVVFMVPDPLVINCTVSTSPGVTKVDCDASKELFLSPSCSLLMVGAADSQPLICSLTGIELTSDVYQPGEYVLTITAIDVEEQTTTVQVSLTVRGAGDSLVQCRTTLDCSGNMTLMSARDCCVSNPDGLSFTVPGVETCQVCIVYGWFNDSFTGKEQGSSVSIPVGYQKGAAVAAQNLVFDVADQPITAKRGPSLDYTLNSPRVRALFTSPAPDNAIVTFRVDAIAQEPDETLILLLNPLIPGPTGDAVFFRDNITLTIVDSDTVEIGLAEDDFRTGETGQLPVVVAKSSRIASPITLTISPLTVDEAVASGKPLPPNIPEDNPLSPSRANLDDFNNTVLTITFEADEDTTEINELGAPIPVINDVINEAIEQVFVIQLSLVSSLNPAGVDISSRSASLGRIIDDDPIRIGFEEASYTFSEPTSSEGIYSIYLAKENNVVSEQTFHVDVEVSGSVPPGSSLLPATLGNDYRVSGTNSSSVIISFPPSSQRVSFSFVLLPDDASEGDEGFLASSMPSDSGDAPTYLNPIGLTTESLVVISSGPIEPLLYGQCILDPTLLRVYCNTSLDETLVPFSYTCSYNSGPAEPCSSDFFIDALRFGVGSHILDVTIATEFGQVLNVSIPFMYEGPLSPMLECVEVADARVITLGCSSLVGGLVDFATCSFDGGPGIPCELPFQVDQYSFSTEPHTLTVAFNLTTGREGEYQFNFTGEVREPAVFELPSDEGVIDIIEGIEYEKALLSSGFTYSSVPIRVYSLTYSEYMDRGFNLEDDFNSNTIPTLAANAYDYKEVDTTLSGLAGGIFVPPSLSLNAYQDGIAEQPEGFVLRLEIVESELDPRDMGNVSLSRSVYLVRINQSDTSNFQVLIGDVELGQDRPELLDVAAMDGESVRVFVTNEIQTAIVTNGASILLDWFRWVTETLGDSAINATFTIQRIELDENGDPDEEPEEVESNDRIEVEFESDENEYYVKISRVIARETDDEDPDRAIYNLEACVPQPDGGERCYSSNVTVFAIQVIELQCIETPGTRLLAINCSSPGNGPIDSATCSFDGGPAAPCSLSFLEIDQYSFSPGPHTLNIVFNLTSGEEGEGVYEFTGLVREPGVFRFSSNRGVIDITEGIEYEQSLQSTGFSYSTVPIQMYTLTYSEYAARGFNLEDTIDSSVIPAKAASAYDYEAVNTTLPGLAGGSFSPPSLSLNAYQDGVAEESEGFILYLEIVESELDPRDVGSVSVSRSAYLIRINQSNTSNFELLIGDVELGQEVPGLLDVAARDGDRVRVFVTDDIQTAIVTNGAYILLDWSRWVTEVLGDSASSANFTIFSIELDENGDPVEDPEEVESNDRIEVEFESDESEYYVKVSRVVARETAEDDPDRHIYELEACVAQLDGSQRCYRSNITLFALDPARRPLEFDCSEEAMNGYVRVTCESNNPLVSPQLCTLESIEEEEEEFNCSATSLMLSVEDYPPGDYNLTIKVFDVFGQNADLFLSFFLPEPLLHGQCILDPTLLRVYCNTSLDETRAPFSYTCSYNSGPAEPCSSDFFIDALRFGVGSHILDVTIATEFGQVLNVPTIRFMYEGPLSPMLECVEIADARVITLGCSSLVGGLVDFATCSFDGGPGIPCELPFQIDQYSFSTGPHTLTVAFNLTTGREGEYQFNFTGEVREPAVFELPSDEGVIDIIEGIEYEKALLSSGFTYSSVPIRVYSLTYSEYMARGFNLEDDFNSNAIPTLAANAYDYKEVDTTLSGLAGGIFVPPSLSLNAYQDGIAEQPEGFVLLLDIVESELDPRDVGNVSLSRSVYLVRINQSDTSNFQVLIGDVELGQDRPELLDVAAMDGESVRVFVTNEIQTAIVTNGASILLDWFRWVTETLGDSAINATFTIQRIELDENGDPDEEPEEAESNDRIEVEFESDENEYYVKISHVIARETDDEDPDRAIYDLEACVPQPDGGKRCYSSNVTIFAIQVIELQCIETPGTRLLAINCSSPGNGPIDSATCSFDGGPAAPCSLSFLEIDQYSFSPGPHTLNIVFNLTSGEEGEGVYEFTGLVREPGVFRFSSNRGVIDITEGIEYEQSLQSTGFSYSTVPIQMYTLTYSEYAARGFILEDTIDSSVIPAKAASAYDYEAVNTTLPGLAGGSFSPPSLSLNAYQDGVAEESEGFILYLEIVESELDPRDVGSVSVSRSAYLIRINQSNTSNFELLIGDVELGQEVPGLLDVAARDGDRVRVFVTDDIQTAIVTDGAYILLDWSRWVTEVLGDSASSANFTIFSIELDENGDPVEDPEEVESNDRIKVEFESDESEYYVKVSRVVARETAEDDPDRHIYELEACVAQLDGSQRCYRSNITVFALDPARRPLEFDCSEEAMNGYVRVTCESNNPLVSPQLCTLESIEEEEEEFNCSATSLMLSVEDYPPGDYNLTIKVFDVFGQNADLFLSFFLPEPLLHGQCILDPTLLRVYCNTSLDETRAPFSYTCSYNSGPAEPCSSDFFIDALRFGVGSHILDVTIATEFGQVLNVPTIRFMYEGPLSTMLECVEIADARVITLGCSSLVGGLVDFATCSFDGGPGIPCELPFQIDQYSFSTQPHTLTVAFNLTTGREGEYQFNFTGEVREPAVFELPSDEGVIDIIEGIEYEKALLSSGFTYSSVPIRVYSLTYSEYMARGFNLEDDFNSNAIPTLAANAYDYKEVDTTLSGLAGGIFVPPSLSLNAYQDGIAEQPEGFVLLLDIVESELDPRDVGNVSLSRSVYLVRINQSDTSNFQVLIGDVELGQDRPELLDVAAMDGESVRVFVTNEIQTAIVTNGASILLDWFRWVTETLGDSAINATFTIQRIELDENGDPDEEPEEVESNDRIEVEFESDENEYYVKISRVIARETDDEDPDRAIYNLEACVPQPDRSERCYSSNVTIFAIQVIELRCIEAPGTRLLAINCSSPGNGPIDSATCSFDGGPAAPCSLSFLEIDQYSFSPGPHTLNIVFNLTSGEEGEGVYEFTGLVREPGVFRFSSNRGVIDIIEGIEYEQSLQSTGFSYSTVPIQMYTLTYSEYAARGFNLEDTIDSSVIPAKAASAYDYEAVNTTLPGLAGGSFSPPSLSLNAYQDGVAEESEGFVLYLEIVESELDPRDVGSVSVSRSAYLIRINQSNTSNFELLIGDVELGQEVPGLLDVAARDGDRVRVFVTDDIQTAIVTNGAYILLDWSRWVTEVLGDSASSANFTIFSIELDENGDPDEDPEEVESNDRIEVEFESDENEYYVKISRVIARETDDEDPDRAIYDLEACVPQPDGGERCYSSNVTVFAIQVIELRCIETPGTRLLAINCSSPGNGPIDSATCSFDGGPAAPCSLSFLEIDQYSFSPGPHTLNIVFNLTSGEEGEGVYEFTGLVREPGVFRFSSNRGVIDITEGIEYEQSLQSTGFSYSTVPIQMYTLTYSEYAARGFNLEDTIDSSVIPAKAASAYDYEAVNTTLPGLAGGSFSPPSLSLNAYQDGVAEESEGFILYLEIVESELDPRDVGSVSVSRSAYLIRINQSNTSNFELLIGDVELGQEVPGLLDVAARDGDRVRVFVTDDIQTAIVTDGAYILLDWSRWVTEVLGDSASSANFTIFSIELDENGDPVEDPEEVESNDRIEVEFESDESEYYVKISRVVARETAEDDPDRHIYELEACVAQLDGSQRCYRSNITVFALDPARRPLEFDCSEEAVNGYVRVTCESNNPLVSPQLCTLESIEEKEEEFNCSATSLMLSVEDYPPGDYNLTIEVFDVFGQNADLFLSFFLPEPLLHGQCILDPTLLRVYCNTSLDETLVPFSYTCSYNSGPAEPCSSDFFIDALRFGVGSHILDVTIATEFGQVLNVPTIRFMYEGPLSPMLECVEIADARVITLGCSSVVGGLVDFATCSFDGGPGIPCELPFQIDQYSFSTEPHTLTVAFNLTTGRGGEYQFNFTGEVREPAVFELPSDEGVIDIIEGIEYEKALLSSGFTYSSVPIRVYSLTYSEYMAGGFNLEDDFNSNAIPTLAANAYDYKEVDTTLSGLAGGIFVPPSLSLNAYQDGIAEQPEGFVLRLEIVESELDPRDMGNVSLSRSVYLVRINQSDTSNFQVLIGDVELGQDRPELLDVAAMDGESVRVFVTNEIQTAIVTNGASILLDWFRWVTETLGDSAINATFTIQRIELDENGDPDEEPEEVESNDRIEVEFESDENEYYVKISRVIARETDDEDPDRAIYNLEACVPQPDRSERCYSSNVTIFAIQVIELRCIEAPGTRLLAINCSSPGNGPIDSATCSFDGGPAAPCSLSFLEIDQYSFSPGPHTLNIVFNLTSGEEGEGVYEFTGLVREPGVFRFSSNRGVIDITEGIEYEQSLQSTGFSYSTVPIQMYTLTYSEYAARGFNLEDTIDSSVIPAKAASAYDYEAVNTTLPGLAGGSFSPPSLSLNAYQDGVAEESEGFVLYLEIVESELDPRDVGSVSVSRSAYLIRINQSNTSNFELLIGDVELGQEVPGLLDVAARDGDRVRVFVTDDIQTAVVTNGAYILLDWSRWVTEVLGDSASSANFTIFSIELDENGDPVEDPEEVESNDRIEVEFESDESEYYVKISRVVARETAEDDPDRHIYELEACVAQPGGSDRCYTSNITVFAIDTLPPAEALELDCSVEAVSGTVTVTCGSNNPLESPEACTLEALEEESFNFSCNAALFVISVDDYPPGEYNLTIEAEDIFDQRVSEVVPIFISERLLIGSCYIGLSDLTVFCNTTLDQTQVDLDYFCSYDSGPFESCGPNFVVDEGRLGVGLHSLDITISTELGQVLRVPTLGFVITELMLVCFPVAGLNFITYSCSSPDREIDSASCSFDDGPAVPCDIESYTIDQFSFSPGPHILTIVYNVTSGRVGEHRLNFTGEIRPPAIFNELQSDDGIIDIIEGLPFSDVLFVRGFSYGPIPIRISTLTYSEYEARGFNLEDDFNTSVIPIDAADVYDYRTIDTTISPTAGSPNMYELTFDAYLDGLAEELEGFVLYLEVMESELDPRDVGQITLSRSVYLIVINQSDTSNFEILIGDVLLGQDIPGLLDVAARDGDRVRVFVTNETQTAIVTEGAYVLLDWFRWVTETLGDSAVNTTFTLYRTELNESGDPIGPAEVVNASTDRIEIEFEFDESEFYVKITEVVARETEDEDPDRAIYELEACIPQPDGSEQCYSSDITVFAIDTTPQLEFICSTSGFDGMVTISCESNNPLLSPQMCTPLPLEVLILCNASSFTLSVGDYIPGYYNFTIDATDVFGQTATVVVPLFLSEPILFGSCILDPAVSQLAVFCNTSLDQTLVPLEYTCSYDSGPEEPCGPNIIIDRTRFSPGPHLLDVTIMTLFGQTLRVPSIPFFVEVPPIVELQCDVVPLARVLTLNCSSPSGPVALATCSFDGGPPILCDLDALVIDQFAFSPGFHMLNISALVAGGQGSFLYNFTGQVRPSVEIELSSDEGLIDVNEGELSFNMFLTEGFSYGSIVITMSILTYSEYEERSYNLTDSFDSDDIPANPANDYDYNSTLGREARIVFDPVGFGMVAVPPPLGIYAYIDGLAEKIEGLVVYLELVESELDSRDVGQVALERSTYLIRINQSRFSTFEIIIGEVELGQRPELLEVAAQPRTEVLAFVTEDQQTAVAAHSARIRLDWSQWVEDELGSSAGEANYTIYRTQLNITGGVQGPPEVLSPTPSDLPSRIVVRINPENNEFYVEVLSVNIVGGAEDPDHAIYELEACYFEDDGSRDCERTSITLYAIGQVPVLISADEDDEPEETPSGLRSPVGADFCLAFDSSRRVLELTCGIEVENTIPFPLPERLWYKDGVLVYEAKIGEIPVIREEFYQTGNNSLLMPGVISPLPLMATSDGTLFLDWRAVNLTLPDQLPTGVTEETFRMELFKTLLGTWECELENSLGESEAETTLTDCATDAVDLECESSIGNVFVRVMECEAEFELVDIQCSINRTTLGNCSFPLSINRLDYSEYQHTLRINVTDSRGMTDTFELQFNGIMAGNLPALSIDFQVLDDPRSPGAGSSRVVFLPEAPTTSSIISIEVSGGDTVAPIPFHVLPLTYDEFEARYPNVDLNDLFPIRPLDPAGDSDFNTNSLTFTGPSSFSPNVVIADSIPELSEGFIIYLEVDRANTDPRDLSRIQFLNRHILAVIEDDDALVTCNANVMDNEVIVNCPGIDGLPPGNPYQCSVDFSPPESCSFPYEIARSSVPPGRHNIRLFQRSAGEPIPDQILGGAQFQIDPLSIRFVNNTPILNVDRVYAEIEISRPGVSMECHLTRVPGSRTNCSNGRYEYTGLRPGDFTLRVVAKDPFISERSNPNFRAIARNRLWVHGDNVFCVTHLKNDGITIDQNTLTVDFYSTGNPTGFLCSFDRGAFFECSSPYIRDNIPIGRHRIKVIPQGCGRDFRGHTAQFDVI